ncbi:nucleotide sugar dehydrogenase [bacterium]|nr:nucleotide sugar dehydrogenase [bacterium]
MTKSLMDKIKSKKVNICIVGLGFVGLPLAAVLTECGFSVLGLDKNEKIIKLVNNGKHHLGPEPGMNKLMKKVKGKLKATTKNDVIKDSDIIIVSVPLYVKNKKPDYSILNSAFKAIEKNIKDSEDKKLIIIETTTPIGYTERVAKKLAKKTNKKLGKDLFVAHSSERIQTGHILEQLVGLPKTVGGVEPKSTEIACKLYSSFTKTIPVLSSRAEEAVKIFEGVYRDVNIALVNELAKFSTKVGINIFEAIKAANTQPFCHLHQPGVGVSGHCIPVYPWFIINQAEKYQIKTELIKKARLLNDSMPRYVLKKLKTELKKKAKTLKNSKITVLGLTFKPDSPGTYHTMSEIFIKLLRKYTNKIIAYDPFIKSKSQLPYRVSLARNLKEAIQGRDAIVVMTEHKVFRKINISGNEIVIRKKNLFSSIK